MSQTEKYRGSFVNEVLTTYIFREKSPELLLVGSYSSGIIGLITNSHYGYDEGMQSSFMGNLQKATRSNKENKTKILEGFSFSKAKMLVE